MHPYWDKVLIMLIVCVLGFGFDAFMILLGIKHGFDEVFKRLDNSDDKKEGNDNE